MDPDLQLFAIKLANQIISEVESIVTTYMENPELGFSFYLDFIKKMRSSIAKIILEGLRDPVDVGHISSRLLRDPLEIALAIQQKSSEEKEAHVVGYLKAILQLVYCGAKGLEGWDFPMTLLYNESQKLQNIGKIYTISSLAQIVKQELSEIDTLELYKNVIKETKAERENLEHKKTQNRSRKRYAPQNLFSSLNNNNIAVSFTARLMAYYRSQEYKNSSPLIIDPFAEQLAGDMAAYANKHKFIAQRGDYPIVRSYYIENTLLIPWCNKNKESQIVLFGAGLDTRAYRLKSLQTNKHTIFEIDFPATIEYKQTILKDENPLCDLIRVSEDLSNPNWGSSLIDNGFSTDMSSFWVLEGLAYYMEQKSVIKLLQKAAKMSTKTSQIFIDVCVPNLVELQFGPFTPYFKWGLEKKAVPSFFASTGWNVSCVFADDYDQGRDVGQRGLIFVFGLRN